VQSLDTPTLPFL